MYAKYFEILETLPNAPFDDIVFLAAQICEAPIAAVNLSSDKKHWCISKVGVEKLDPLIDLIALSSKIISDEVLVLSDVKLVEIPDACSFAGVALRAPNGDRFGTLCVLDKKTREFTQGHISALKALSRQTMNLLEMRKASEISELKSEFLANISHEIRTPMNTIVGMTEVLAETPLDEKQQTFVQVLRGSSKSLLNLLNDILDYSRIESGAVRLDNVPFSLTDVIKNVIEIIAIKAEEKHLKFTINFDENVPDAVSGDPNRIRQILINLLSNAVKFTEKGSVDLHISLDKPATSASAQVLFKVKDTGIGIAPENMGKLFKRFYQVDPSSSRTKGGSGLGLAITKHLVELQKGSIEVSSHIGRGSEFSFSIPFDRVSAPQVSKSGRVHAKTTTISHNPLKILLVDDHDENRFLIQTYLQSYPCEITVVDSGERAIESFDKTLFDVVLMDLQMPVMDGFAAIRAMRALERKKESVPVPIVALSASAMNEDRAKSLAAGADLHLSKPIQKHVLIETLDHFVRAYRQGQENDPELKSLVANYLKNRARELETLRNLLSHLDFATMTVIGHRIRGVAGSYGFPEIGKIGESIETLAIQKDEPGLKVVLSNLENLLIEITSQSD